MATSTLTSDHYKICNDCLRKAAEIKADIDRMKKCGFDCHEHEERLNTYIEFATNVKREYFPNKP